jgi:protein-disulfide isomerase
MKKIIFYSLLIIIIVGGIWWLIRLITNLSHANQRSNFAISVNSQDDPYLGPEIAGVTVVEFADFACQYCREEFSIIRELAVLYPQVKFIFRDLPLVNIHENALPAAIAANCAGKQNKFWAFHDQLYLNQDQLGQDLYQQIAKNINLDFNQWQLCLTNPAIRQEISADINDAAQLGAIGTPTFVINGKVFSGVVSLIDWQKIINLALAP